MANDVVYQTSYTPTIRPALAGMPATTYGYNADSRLCETAAGIGFGLAVSQGSGDKGATLGGTAAVGVSIRDITLIHGTAVLDKYSEKENMGVLVAGDIWVQVSEAVDVSMVPSFDATTGVFCNAGSGKTTFGSARWIKGAAGEGLALLRVNQP